jgi:WD40 repeat protein
MDILPIKEQNIIATAALDGKICLWDAATEKNSKTLGGENNHQKGITCLDWYPHSNCLLSAGLDHDVFIFNTLVKEKIFTLKGHSHPLAGVKWVPNTYQIVSCDISGMVKIWDSRTMLCQQTFNSPTQEVNSFCVTYPTKRIVLGAKNMIFFDYDEPKHEFLTDEKMCLKIIYNEVLFAFITLHPDNVKVWDARNGETIAAHRDLTEGELTCCCLDDRERKLFLGDTNGNIISINVRNGARLREFKSHEKGANPNRRIVSDLAYFAHKNTKLLVSSS